MRFELASSLDILRRTPATLRALLEGAGDGWTRSNEGRETFSPFDVVGHLIDGEETDWMPRARLILSRNPEAVFTPYDASATTRGTGDGRSPPFSMSSPGSAPGTSRLSRPGTWAMPSWISGPCTRASDPSPCGSCSRPG